MNLLYTSIDQSVISKTYMNDLSKLQGNNTVGYRVQNYTYVHQYMQYHAVGLFSKKKTEMQNFNGSLNCAL